MKRAILLIVAVALLQGCGVAMLVGMAVAVGYVDSKERAAFAEVNVEREKAGLEPLLWDEYHKPHKEVK